MANSVTNLRWNSHWVITQTDTVSVPVPCGQLRTDSARPDVTAKSGALHSRMPSTPSPRRESSRTIRFLVMSPPALRPQPSPVRPRPTIATSASAALQASGARSGTPRSTRAPPIMNRAETATATRWSPMARVPTAITNGARKAVALPESA